MVQILRRFIRRMKSSSKSQIAFQIANSIPNRKKSLVQVSGRILQWWNFFQIANRIPNRKSYWYRLHVDPSVVKYTKLVKDYQVSYILPRRARVESVPEVFAIWNVICDLEEVFITVGSYVILVPDFFAIWNTICDLKCDFRFGRTFHPTYKPT